MSSHVSDPAAPMPLAGIHHVTSIAGDPQRNLDFCVGVLGLRLVKRTVNFDLPDTYHLYFGDAVGTPGTILTIFPWPRVSRRPPGTGQIAVTAFTVPARSLGYWRDRLVRHGVAVTGPFRRFDDRVIQFADPDGLRYELVAVERPPEVTAWQDGPVPPEHAVRGFHGVTIWEAALERTAAVLGDLLGFRALGEEEGRVRFQVGDGPARALVDVVVLASAPRGAEGVGTVHHIAWRTRDDASQLAWQARVADRGLDVTPVRDREYFRSIYFREPGGVLFEIATDPPGFGVDEPPEALGTGLRLPPWLEPRRAALEQSLPPLRLPAAAT
ncbi:MAG TPA: ring-cleaving dioxygenase [Thermomicrobiaceae bacterium]|nr:ring-cleaving dioxygenase [Thermomicrobiaceae bacterium]